jgi:hypothetical protein
MDSFLHEEGHHDSLENNSQQKKFFNDEISKLEDERSEMGLSHLFRTLPPPLDRPPLVVSWRGGQLTIPLCQKKILSFLLKQLTQITF